MDILTQLGLGDVVMSRFFLVVALVVFLRTCAGSGSKEPASERSDSVTGKSQQSGANGPDPPSRLQTVQGIQLRLPEEASQAAQNPQAKTLA